MSRAMHFTGKASVRKEGGRFERKAKEFRERASQGQTQLAKEHLEVQKVQQDDKCHAGIWVRAK